MSTNETILIVDDSPDNLVVMKKVIQKALPDVTIVTCQEPEKAMPLLHDRDVALALLDIQMPGIDGLELCKRIKDNAETQSVSVILITSHDSDPKMKARGMELGADDFVTRPIDNTELIARVKVALRVHRAEASLRQTVSDTLRQSAHIVSSSSDMMALLTSDFVYLTVNDAYRNAFGKLRDEIVGHSVLEVFGEEMFNTVIEPRAKACMLGKRARYSEWIDFPVAGIRFMDVEFSPYSADDGTIIGFVINARDITERKLAEESVEKEFGMRTALLDNIPGCIAMVLRKGTREIVDSNKLARELGATSGHTCFEACAARDSVCPFCLAPELLRTGQSQRVEVEYRGTWYEGMWEPLSEDLYVHYIFDITERKRAEEERRSMEAQLRQSQKLESIGTLAGGVAHEINNPINGIMNYAQLILDRLGPDSPVTEFATEIGKETERVATIVKDLLSFARHDKEGRSPARLCDIVESTLSLTKALLRRDQIALEVDVPEDLPKIECSSPQIRQVIMNLLTNARDVLNEKYEGFDENKKVMITARVLDKDGRQWIRTTIEDSGQGISEAVRERMFDPFYTTKPKDKGTGLGLSISHGIINDHHGEITVESEVGEWTRFHVDLPVDGGKGAVVSERD